MDDVKCIVEGIAAVLSQQTGYVVYTDYHKQHAQFPCFYIDLIDASQEQELGNRYWREYAFDIMLFLDKNGEIHDRRRLMAMADTAFMMLEYIAIEGDRKLRGTDMNYRITDNVLHVFVSYNTHILKEADALPVMQTLHTEGGIIHE
ncbi:DUF6838 family protein [uncultured Megasphaera sp.]|uniref:phage tail terminator family protein n=1 Tax=uncultured Megasphaera sp. TaxID=165188 RepID=UPI002659A542|nr:hypothetical protein [uncultured Megasphaera sp.]